MYRCVHPCRRQCGNWPWGAMIRMNMPSSRLELREVSKTYTNGEQPVEVLHAVSLAAEAGTVTALLGRSGCGKSTLLNLAGAMDFPTTGEILIEGRATAAPPHA